MGDCLIGYTNWLNNHGVVSTLYSQIQISLKRPIKQVSVSRNSGNIYLLTEIGEILIYTCDGVYIDSFQPGSSIMELRDPTWGWYFMALDANDTLVVCASQTVVPTMSFLFIIRKWLFSETTITHASDEKIRSLCIAADGSIMIVFRADYQPPTIRFYR
jgi:hypothetical protein